ncbi:50S ribosomal protein L21 [Alphaproteobacteria bacterium]|nr:50S ribosomal protein L21 [Alphaproteobacteria bacterium]
MFAILRSGGKQYTLRQGDVLRLEKLEGDAGRSIVLQEILAIGEEDKMIVGNPTVSGAGVQVKILETKKDKKVLIFKKKRRHTYKRLKGHRQWLTVVRVESLLEKDADKAAKAAAAAPTPKAEEAKDVKAAPAKEADAPKKAAVKAPAKPAEKKAAASKDASPAKKTAAPKKAAAPKKEAAPKKAD